MKTVLIVEDEKMIRQGMRAMVQRSGVPVEVIMECSNGQMALEILKEQKIDVMFTDIRMPKMDGIELVQAMQGCEHVPLTVAVSGYDDFSYAVEMLRGGVREYLLKPVDRDKVREILEKFNREIEENRQKDEEIRSISHRQLKYLMLQENVEEEELAALVSQFGKLFYEEPYVVYCRETGEKGVGDYICLEEVAGQQVFIVEETKKEILCGDVLKGSFAGESLPHQGLRELRQAYLESRAARCEAFGRGKGIALYTEEKAEREYVPVDTNRMHQIVQMLATDKIEEACRIFDGIVWEVKRGRSSVDSFAENIRILTDGIWSTYQNILEVDSGKLAEFANLFAWASLDAFAADMTAWMRGFHGRIHTEFEDYRNKHKIQKAVEYIRENYGQELNMAVVSNMISMNYSLFSYEFKRYTGSNFVNYLRDIRMGEAKRLLAETDLRIAEIGKRVGYDNEKHFMKTFKAACGVSPTEYRKNQDYS